MVQREMRVQSQICPDCGGKLSVERDLFLCKEHGAFFAYGPQLLVRAPRADAESTNALLPWENPRASLA